MIVRGLRPQAAALRVADRAEEALVLRLCGGGGEGGGELGQAEDVRGLRHQAAALWVADRAEGTAGIGTRVIEDHRRSIMRRLLLAIYCAETVKSCLA